MPDPTTPCINVCVIEPSSGFCLGCGRTLEEISQWGGLNDRAREAIRNTLADRLEALRRRPRSGERVLPSRRRRHESGHKNGNEAGKTK
jgi:uncharacterized protein